MDYRYQPEVITAITALCDRKPQTRAYAEMEQGTLHHEPLLIGLDAMLRYAKAYKTRWNIPLKHNAIFGPQYWAVVDGLHELLNGPGGYAMEQGWTGDSKGNETLERIFWLCLDAGGFSEED